MQSTGIVCVAEFCGLDFAGAMAWGMWISRYLEPKEKAHDQRRA